MTTIKAGSFRTAHDAVSSDVFKQNLQKGKKGEIYEYKISDDLRYIDVEKTSSVSCCVLVTLHSYLPKYIGDIHVEQKISEITDLTYEFDDIIVGILAPNKPPKIEVEYQVKVPSSNVSCVTHIRRQDFIARK